MEFKEIEGDRTKSKLLETTDHHIYRRNKANSPYLSCYFSSLTKIMLKTSPNAEKCQGKSFISYLNKANIHIDFANLMHSLAKPLTENDFVK